jgi:hypothetical protein
LAEQLHRPFVSLDRLEQQYTQIAGFDANQASHLQTTQGDWAWYSYRRGFFDEAVAQFLRNHTSGVLELGGGHPIAPDDQKQARINEALAPFRNVVLLMPVPDLEASLAILKRRQKPERLNPDLNELLLKDGRFFEMAKWIIYTHRKLPDEVCQDIIDSLGLRP